MCQIIKIRCRHIQTQIAELRQKLHAKQIRTKHNTGTNSTKDKDILGIQWLNVRNIPIHSIKITFYETSYFFKFSCRNHFGVRHTYYYYCDVLRFIAVVPKVCSTDPKWSATTSQGVGG